MIDVISARKVELEGALQDKTMSKAEVADELRYLLQLVRDVEQNNKAHAVTTLTSRKASLVNLADDKASKTTKSENTDKGLVHYEKAVKEAQEAVDAQNKTVQEKQKAFDDWLKEDYDGPEILDKDENPVDEQPKKNSDLEEDKQHESDEYKALSKAKTELTVKEGALKAANEAHDFAKEHGSAAIPIIISVAAIALIGGGCYCYRKN